MEIMFFRPWKAQAIDTFYRKKDSLNLAAQLIFRDQAHIVNHLILDITKVKFQEADHVLLDTDWFNVFCNFLHLRYSLPKIKNIKNIIDCYSYLRIEENAVYSPLYCYFYQFIVNFEENYFFLKTSLKHCFLSDN